MNKFNTPSKEITEQQPQKGSAFNLTQTRIQYSEKRSGDWICCNCNNLNYSFRKKCNRCKTQTRESNISPLSAYSYYYFPNNTKPFQENQNVHQLYYHNQAEAGQDLEQFPFPSEIVENQSRKNHNFSASHTALKVTNFERTPPKKSKLMQFNSLGTPELPSVSPLIKKYKQSKQKNVRTTIGDRKGKCTVTVEQFDRGNIFDAFDSQQGKREQFGDHQTCLKNVFIRDFDDYSRQIEYQQNCGEDYDEIQRLISNLIIE